MAKVYTPKPDGGFTIQPFDETLRYTAGPEASATAQAEPAPEPGM